VGIAFVLPAIAILSVFSVYPLFSAVGLSVTKRESDRVTFVGAEHYSEALSSAAFWDSVRVTLWYAIGTVPITIALSLSIALALFRVRRVASLFRVAFFVPYITSTVAAALVWRTIFEPRGGLATSLFERLGLPAQTWLLEPRGVLHLLTGGAIATDVGPSLALVCVIVFAVWRYVGFMIVVILAGLANVPREYEEAARIDGASTWRVSRYVTLPLLTPTIFFLVIVSGIGALQAFSDIYAMTGDGHGPLDTTQNLAVYLFTSFYDDGRFEYGAAVAVLLAAGIVALTALQWRAFAGRVHYE
jgi:multiple sugar transport system permease protein